jgi:VanZ family protein
VLNILRKINFGWLSFLIVAGYFAVGFWPFDFFPRNQVSWLPNHTGLRFQPYAIADDPLPLPPTDGSDVTSRTSPNFTVELWLEAQHEPANNVFDILTIHNPSLPYDFAICQWRQDFLVRATTQSPQPFRKAPEIGVDDGLAEGRAQVITVRTDGTGTDLFVNGKASGHFPQFVLNAHALEGQLILGNDAGGKHSWSGRLFGLAIYHRAVNSATIARHCFLWTQNRTGQLTNAPSLTALYLLDEGHGTEAQDSSANRHHLIIPAVFQPVQRELLTPPWKDLSDHHPDYSDITINVLGFMPFGFCFFLYRQPFKPNRWLANAATAVLAGAAVSLAIEIVQAWLPNRSSSVMDLLTNTTGTLLGVLLAMAMGARQSAVP